MKHWIGFVSYFEYIKGCFSIEHMVDKGEEV